jgi:hypothetical protein
LALPPSIEVRSVPDGTGSTALFIRVPWRVQRPQAASQLAYMACFGISYFVFDMLLSTALSLALAAVLVALIWSVRMFNQTHITVSSGQVAVRHAPIPWLSRVLSAPNIEQLYVRRRPLAQKKFDYNVCAHLHDSNDEVIFLHSLSEPSVALFLEQCIEDHLQIVDRRVSGAFDAGQFHSAQPTASPGYPQPPAGGSAPPGPSQP